MTIYVCRRPRAVYLTVLVERVNGFVETSLVVVESYSPFPSMKLVAVNQTTVLLPMVTVPFSRHTRRKQQHMINHKKNSSRVACKSFNHLPLWEILQRDKNEKFPFKNAWEGKTIRKLATMKILSGRKFLFLSFALFYVSLWIKQVLKQQKVALREGWLRVFWAIPYFLFFWKEKQINAAERHFHALISINWKLFERSNETWDDFIDSFHERRKIKGNILLLFETFKL